MDILQKELSFDSSVDSERIFVRVFEPADASKIRGIVQIAHGMAEHSLCYVPFCRYLAGNGFVVAANDHLGHGKSVSTGSAYGYFGEGGTDNLVRDMKKLSELLRQAHPALPFFLLGHSMGSFLSRDYTAQYGTALSGAVYIGTCGPMAQPFYAAELRLANHLVRKKGAQGHHPFFKRLSTEQFNKQFANARTPNDWVSRDEKEVDRYTEDPLCGFDLTTSGYRDILLLQKKISAPEWFRSMPDIPILLLAGDKDPVGNNGKGVRQVAERLRTAGKTRVELELYPEGRHAVLTETNKEEVFERILRFLEEALAAEKKSAAQGTHDEITA